MQIACEKCSTQYVLDERVIPPGGAPVQCTRCGHVFVAIPGEPKKASSGTQIFGVTPSEPSRTTQIFGKVKQPESAAPRASTQIFGASKHVAPAPEEPRPTTQMFGAVALPAAAAESSEDAPEPRSTTQMFGRVDAGAPQPRAATQMFGQASGGGPPEPRAATQMFGQASGGGAPEPRSTTQMFGQAPGGAPEPRSTTQMFGQAPGGAPEPRSTTQMFGQADQPAPARGGTQVFGRTMPAGGEGAVASGDDQATPVHGSLAARPAPARVELPPEQPVFAPGFAEDQVVGETPDRLRRSSAARRKSGGAVLVLVLAVLGAAGYFAWREISKRQGELPPEVKVTYENAVRELRRDDAKSRDAAVETLTKLIDQHPRFAEARATLLIARLFELDELRTDGARIQNEQAYLEDRIAELNRVQSPADWETRVAVANERLQQLRVEIAPVRKQIVAAEEQVARAKQALEAAPVDGPETERAVLGAQALHEAISGNSAAIVLSTRYKSQGPPGGWGALAYAEFALNGGAPPDTLAQARNELEALLTKDVGLIRGYVLSGRLAMAQRDYDGAVSLFERVLLLNDEHPFARAQLRLAQKRARE